MRFKSDEYAVSASGKVFVLHKMIVSDNLQRTLWRAHAVKQHRPARRAEGAFIPHRAQWQEKIYGRPNFYRSDMDSERAGD